MEMPDINLARADLHKYNQAPNYLANQVTIHIAINIYIYIIYIYNEAFQESHSKFVNKRQEIPYIF